MTWRKQIGRPLTAGLAVGLASAVIVANAVGVRWGSRIQNLTVVLKLAALAGR